MEPTAGSGKRLERSRFLEPEFWERARYAVDHGIRYSDLIAWPDTDLAIVDEVLARKRRECPSCGLTPEDSGWYDEEGKLHRHEEPRFEAVALRCYSCFDKEIAREEIPPDETKGLYIAMLPTAAALDVASGQDSAG